MRQKLPAIKFCLFIQALLPSVLTKKKNYFFYTASLMPLHHLHALHCCHNSLCRPPLPLSLSCCSFLLIPLFLLPFPSVMFRHVCPTMTWSDTAPQTLRSQWFEGGGWNYECVCVCLERGRERGSFLPCYWHSQGLALLVGISFLWLQPYRSLKDDSIV